MSGKNAARRTEAEVTFDGVDITKSIKPYLLSITYTDNEEGETDDLQIQIQDREGEWLQSWLEQVIEAASGAGLKFSAAFTQKNWGNDSTLPTGDFELDSVTAAGRRSGRPKSQRRGNPITSPALPARLPGPTD